MLSPRPSQEPARIRDRRRTAAFVADDLNDRLTQAAGDRDFLTDAGCPVGLGAYEYDHHIAPLYPGLRFLLPVPLRRSLLHRPVGPLEGRSGQPHLPDHVMLEILIFVEVKAEECALLHHEQSTSYHRC